MSTTRGTAGWAVVGELVPTDAAATAQFGGSIGLSGGAAVAGAQGANSAAGAFYVFEGARESWKQVFEDNGTWPQGLGSDVAISGEVALGASLNANDGRGVVYVYESSGGTWAQSAVLSTPAGASLFGYSVAVYGDTAVVGAALANNALGAAYVYTRTDGKWLLTATLTSDAQPYAYFGGVVAVTDGWIAVGLGEGGGTIWVYQKAGTGWELAQKLTPGNGAGKGGLAFVGGMLLAGTQFDGSRGENTGAVFVFGFDGTGWTQVQKLTGEAAGDFFGVSVSGAGALLAVGAMGVNARAGAVYLFAWNGSQWVQEWEVPAPADAGGSFGFAVACDGVEVLASASGQATAGRVYVLASVGPVD